MCVGLPMRIESRSGHLAECSGPEGFARVDLALVPEAQVGDYVLVFLGAARRLIDALEARQIADALAALSAVMSGTSDAGALDRAFADLDREPQLPPHLAAALAAGRTEA
ncbi:hydrogenase expression/formation protein [Azorhizobium caulinodans ORS 571]|uniref:Hydrogenase expression/formation protein n=2 Tax=Azorhizobium caulinodans TaxID=7 RepID=A8IMS5_AZOC5|nr:HypC/HybG/HupF family hydrogenase formation chaperone [Azorhizobium caulinodans]AAS91030.1 HupF [Azorhizobium caulinodans ORS 571]BAF86600.1 hydrogenase expression/formation protein [Azorhizobium caulinodans ORS 571]